MWEVFTGGEMPYGNKKNPQVVEDVGRGYRLQKPSYCPETIYNIMLLCWEHVSNGISISYFVLYPKDRPVCRRDLRVG